MQGNIYISDYIKQELFSYGYDEFWINRYIKFLEWRNGVRTFGPNNYYEIHHIVPRSWNKSLKNDKNNQIKLTYREHVIAHHLLMKTGDVKMGTALNIIIGKGRYMNNANYEIRAWMLRLEEQAVEQHKKRIGKPIVDLKTGEVYSSGAEVDKLFGLKLGAVTRSLYDKTKVNDTFYMRLSDMKHDHTFYYNQILEERKQTRLNASLATAKQIVNLNTEKIYDSVSIAAKEIGVSPDTLSGAARYKIRCKKCFWMYVEEVTKTYKEHLEELQSTQIRRTSGSRYHSVFDLTSKVEYQSLKQANEHFGSDVSCHIKNQTPCKGHYLVFSEDKWNDLDDQARHLKENYESKIGSKSTAEYSYAKKVFNLTTNQIFNSIKQASKHYNDTTSAISRSIKNGTPAFGCYWILYENYDESKTNQQQIEQLQKQYDLKTAKANKAKSLSSSQKVIDLISGKVYDSLKQVKELTNQNAANCINNPYYNDHYTSDEKYCFVLLDEYQSLNSEQKIQLLYKDPARDSYKIVNLTTKEIFISRIDAANEYNVTPGNITNACNKVTKCGKCFWCYFKDLVDRNIEKTLDLKSSQYDELYKR